MIAADSAQGSAVMMMDGGRRMINDGRKNGDPQVDDSAQSSAVMLMDDSAQSSAVMTTRMDAWTSDRTFTLLNPAKSIMTNN